MDKKIILPLIMVITAAMIWGYTGTCTRPMSEFGLTNVQMTFVRSIVTVVVLAVFIPIIGKDKFRIRKKDLWIFILFGMAKLLMDLLYVYAQILMPLSTAAILLSTEPSFVLILVFFVFKESITSRKAVAVLIGFLGCAMVVDVFNATGDITVTGIIAGLGSGVMGATYTVGCKVAMKRDYEPTPTLFYITLVDVIVLIPFSGLDTMTSIATEIPESVWYMLSYGIVFTLIPYMLFTISLKYLSPSIVSVCMFLESVSATIAGYLVYSEVLTAVNLAGMALVFLSIIIMTMQGTRRTKTGKPDGT